MKEQKRVIVHLLENVSLDTVRKLLQELEQAAHDGILDAEQQQMKGWITDFIGEVMD